MKPTHRKIYAISEASPDENLLPKTKKNVARERKIKLINIEIQWFIL